MKFNFLNGYDGEQSSKRLFSFILVILFAIVVITNLFFGKSLIPSLQDELMYLLMFFYVGVAGEKALSRLGSNTIGPRPDDRK
jgi:hypothetical protein